MKPRSFIYSLFFCCVAFMLMSADECANRPDSVQRQEQRKVEENQKRLMSETDIPILTKSLERMAIKKRLELFEDENKISYIYLISFGKVMAFYLVKGKVTSGSKRLTTNEKLVAADGGQYLADINMEAPGLDGTYGSSGDYIFFWTADNSYIQWNDSYMLCDKPLKMVTAPELYREIK